MTSVRWTPVKKIEPGCGCRIRRSPREPLDTRALLREPRHPLGPALPAPPPPAPRPARGSRRLVPRATKRPPPPSA